MDAAAVKQRNAARHWAMRNTEVPPGPKTSCTLRIIPTVRLLDLLLVL